MTARSFSSSGRRPAGSGQRRSRYTGQSRNAARPRHQRSSAPRRGQPRTHQTVRQDRRRPKRLRRCQQHGCKHAGDHAAERQWQAEQCESLGLRVVLGSGREILGLHRHAGRLHVLGDTTQHLHVRCTITGSGVDRGTALTDRDRADRVTVAHHGSGPATATGTPSGPELKVFARSRGWLVDVFIDGLRAQAEGSS